MQPYTTEMVCCRSIGNRLIILSPLSNIRCVRKTEPAVGTCLTLKGIENRDTLNIGGCNYLIHSRCAKTRGWQDARSIIIDFNYGRACTKKIISMLLSNTPYMPTLCRRCKWELNMEIWVWVNVGVASGVDLGKGVRSSAPCMAIHVALSGICGLVKLHADCPALPQPVADLQTARSYAFS